MDWSEAMFTKCLLKLAYLGTKYHGIAWQDDKLPTVELELFKALTRTCLVKDRTSCSFSRCGRTDKGVHAFGNYISLDLRVKNDGSMFDYVTMLNRVLPNDIRILSVRQVPTEFDARFSCRQRTYKYFFTDLCGLDVCEMEKAAQILCGTHDFRNFCRMDVNQTINYVRTVKSITFKKDSELPVYEVCIVGSAFLWHQVRSMMSCLLLIGEGVEKASLLSSLLDIQAFPRKPIYELADPAGLVLFDCLYDHDLGGDILANAEDGLLALRQSLADSLRDSAVLKCLASISDDKLSILKRVKYTPILKRATAPSLEEKLQAESAKKRRLNNPLDELVD